MVSPERSHVAWMLQQLQTRFPQELLWKGQEEMGWPLPPLALGPTFHPLSLLCSGSKNKGQSCAGGRCSPWKGEHSWSGCGPLGTCLTWRQGQ